MTLPTRSAAGGLARPGEPRPLEEIPLTPEERTGILRGTIILRNIPEPDRKRGTFEAAGTLQGSLEDVFKIITDYRKYPEFMPMVAQTSVTEESGSEALVEFTLKLPLGMTRRYRLRYATCKAEDAFRVSWQKVPWPELKPGETVDDTAGYWLVMKFDAGGLLALAHVSVKPGHVPLGLTGLALTLAKKGVPGMIRNVRRRAMTLGRPKDFRDHPAFSRPMALADAPWL